MARLYDELVLKGYEPRGGEELLRPEGWRRLESCPVIVADNVTEFFFAGTDQEEWDIHDDFPCLAPPFPSFWAETSRPSAIVSEVFGRMETDKMPYRWGCLFAADEPEGDSRCRWRVNAFIFLQRHRRKAIMGFGGLGFMVAENGRCTTGRDGGRFVVMVPRGVAVDRAANESVTRGLVDPLLLAVSFMHCKNVERRSVDQPAPLSKKWEKKHGRPLVRYEVLDIDPMKETLESDGGASEHGLKKALHICRGHFATYTEDAPLFGKVTGTFWKPQHVRGSAKSGAVVKDYNVRGPK